MRKPSTATFLAKAFAAIQSDSIRAWAQTEHNLPHVTRAAEEALAKNPKADPVAFAGMLAGIAIGL
jgi:hypothetical protein